MKGDQSRKNSATAEDICICFISAIAQYIVDVHTAHDYNHIVKVFYNIRFTDFVVFCWEQSIDAKIATVMIL